jgi:hypothetical protein
MLTALNLRPKLCFFTLFKRGPPMPTMLFALAFLGVAFGQTPLTAKVDSFIPLGHATIGAELCGHIVGDIKSAQQVLIVTDPSYKGPGKYVVATTASGEFCAVVATATGLAEVSIIGPRAASPVLAQKTSSGRD